MKPYPLSAGRIDDASLAEDKKTCRKIGPCGIGRHALYLNSFFVDRRYYVPLSMVTRVYKRVAMSKGGFSGKGIFATLSEIISIQALTAGSFMACISLPPNRVLPPVPHPVGSSSVSVV